MDAVEFLKESDRMMEQDEVAFYEANELSDYSQYAAAVEQWSKEHPLKTRLQDFLEKYPKAIIGSDKTPVGVCCVRLGYCESCRYVGCGCYQCWNEPVED